MKTATDPRHLARALALQYLFEYFFERDSTGDYEAKLKNRENLGIPEMKKLVKAKKYDEKLYKQIITGVIKDQKAVDEVITKYAPAWPIKQMSKTSLQILRISVWEGFVSKITPPKVSTDEAIELAHMFEGAEAAKFVNGVLGALIESTNKSENQQT